MPNTETSVPHCAFLISKHGVPKTVMSDNGPQFPSKEFEAFEKPVLLQPDHVKSMLFTEKWNDRANGPSSKTVHEEVR